MGLTLTVLGCDGSYPGPGGASSGYLVRGAGTTIWIDAGSGTLANLQRHVNLDEIDAVVLTHEHPDHWHDLEGFYVAARYVQRLASVRVYAPAGLAAHVYHDQRDPWFRWQEIGDGAEVAVDGLGLRFSRTDHGPETLAVRVDGDGRSLGYSADSGPGWDFSSLGPGVDLAVCEATLPRDQEGSLPGHMSGREAGLAARAGAASALLVTHIWPTADRDEALADASEAFGGPCRLASPNLRIDL
jgi:ribonuclease BN (tRNA processing enzyme)